ncbi:MAG TPA: hypothetical protein ENJ00_08775 [Phycisphaerales bacterium]|nr:hypothetical protein [Phycisphaerales bacterium]
MASNNTKNAVLVIIAIAALGGAVYGIMTSMKGNENPQDQQIRHFVDPESVMSDNQIGITLTNAEFKAKRNQQLVSDPEADARLVPAGKCPHGDHYYPLIGHGEMPPTCPVCKNSLEGYDKDGNAK